MYYHLLFIHGLVRWLVLILLLFSIYVSWRGLRQRSPFSTSVNALRHWTATVAHVQLMIGIWLYVKSPFVKMYFAETAQVADNNEGLFFSIVHIALMFVAIIVLTIGSALAKRRTGDNAKFRTMLLWFLAALILILVAIPWPFSPLAQRPYIRPL